MADGTISKIQLPDNTIYDVVDNTSGYMTGMTILSYGSSTWQNFIDAYSGNKVVYCRASSNANPASGSQTRLAFMAYVNNATTPTEVEFQYYRSVSTHTASQQGDQVYVYKLNKTNGWSVMVREASVKVVAGTGLGGTYSNGTMTLTGPTKVSDLTNDSGFITTETDPTVPSWAKESTKPSYNFSEIGSTPTTLSGYGITDASISSGVITLGNDTITPLTSNSTLNAAKLSGAIPSAVTATTQSSTDNSTKIATTAYVTAAIAALPEPMLFKGSVGTGGTITSLPAAATSNEGFTYKVITALSTPIVAKVGDTVISNGSTWVVIPSGDEPAGTVTSVGLSNATDGGLTISGSPITSSGSITVGHSNVLTSAQTTQAVYPIKIDKNGHITEYGSAVTISDTKNTAGSTDSNSKLFLIGATSQAANPQTYSHDTVYVGTDGCLYSNSKKTLVEQYSNNGYNLNITPSVSSSSADLTIQAALDNSGNFYETLYFGSDGFYISNDFDEKTWIRIDDNGTTPVSITGIKTPTEQYDAVNKKYVDDSIDALDGNITGTAGAGKTLTAFSQTNGKITATFGNISITKSQISDFPTIPTAITNSYSNDAKSGNIMLNDDNASSSTLSSTKTSGALTFSTSGVLQIGKAHSSEGSKGSINLSNSASSNLNYTTIVPSGTAARTLTLPNATGTVALTSDILQSDWNQTTSTAKDYIKNKPTIPTKVSDLTNDSGFITTETDPVFSASVAAGITSTDITSWNNKVTDVEIDGTSVVTGGVAEIDSSAFGTADIIVNITDDGYDPPSHWYADKTAKEIYDVIMSGGSAYAIYKDTINNLSQYNYEDGEYHIAFMNMSAWNDVSVTVYTQYIDLYFFQNSSSELVSATDVELKASLLGHTHGNITNDGDITTTTTIANGDRLVINDESVSKITNSSITFGTSTSQYLANNGTWQNVPSVPTKTSDLTNDSGFINSIKTINNQSLIGSGDITVSTTAAQIIRWTESA